MKHQLSSELYNLYGKIKKLEDENEFITNNNKQFSLLFHNNLYYYETYDGDEGYVLAKSEDEIFKKVTFLTDDVSKIKLILSNKNLKELFKESYICTKFIPY